MVEGETIPNQTKDLFRQLRTKWLERFDSLPEFERPVILSTEFNRLPDMRREEEREKKKQIDERVLSEISIVLAQAIIRANNEDRLGLIHGVEQIIPPPLTRLAAYPGFDGPAQMVGNLRNHEYFVIQLMGKTMLRIIELTSPN